MPEDTKKDKKEKTLSLKTNTTSSKSTIGARGRGSSRVSTVVVESKRGKISKTRKPSAPNIKTRTSSATSRKIKEPTEDDVFGSLTDKERVAREKALLNADTRKKDSAALEKVSTKKEKKCALCFVCSAASPRNGNPTKLITCMSHIFTLRVSAGHLGPTGW